MLRLKRLAVFSLFVFCLVTGFLFWVIPLSGAEARGDLPAPPRAEAKLEVLSTGSTPAVNVTRSADGQWISRAAARTGIPARALQAYVAAVGAANSSTPSCGIGWNTLAAIGSIESAHGTYGGGHLTADGQTSGPIIGPSLNGDGFAAIADTDGGSLDGDSRWDRAVGPMQFIPSTWRYAGRDGNGDGKRDPSNIDDAALSAAAYLCAHGRDLTSARGWTDAIYSYNQSDSYINEVRDHARTYAAQAGAAG